MEGKRRIGVDSNILVSGVLSEWGAAKGVLILAATRVFTIVLVEPVVIEVERVLAKTARGIATYRRLLNICRPERHPITQPDELLDAKKFLPVLRHINDLSILASVLKARPDWFLSDNPDHFGSKLAEATGLNILTSVDFLRRLIVPAP
ncbi:PIN domain-containing protein [Candidatus Poribacteria bacterium]|nr:PIN domain-containing protein [Candidatus Poribacteria bacterium]